MESIKTKNALKSNKSSIIFLALCYQLLMSAVCAQVAQLTALEEANDEKVPFKTESTNSWEYDAGGTTLGDHKIEVRDYVCKQGGDYSGYDADLKVSFTIGFKHTTTSTPLFSNLTAKVTILNWDLEPSDCREASVFNNSKGLPLYGTILPISWSTTFRANGRGQVRVFANLPSFTVNRSWGRLGSMAVTCE